MPTAMRNHPYSRALHRAEIEELKRALREAEGAQKGGKGGIHL